MKKKVTATDVARLAGVSQPTVSMILNEYTNVRFSEETVQRVYRACRELGYIIPSTRSNLRNLEEKIFLVLCPNYQNEYFLELMHAAQTEATNCGYKLIAFDTCRDAKLEAEIAPLVERLHVAGVLVLYHPVNSSMIHQLARRVPVVTVYCSVAQRGIDSLDLSSENAGKIIAEHLLSLGHRTIAFVSTPLNGISRSREERLIGLRLAFQEYGLPAENVLCLTAAGEQMPRSGNWSEYETGYYLTAHALKKYDVTAFVAVNDMVAIGVMDSIREAKKRVPQDYSVVGFDNSMIAKYRSISLTSVEVFSKQRCKEAIDLLVQKVERRSESEDMPASIVKMEYAPKLIVRKSTGIPRRKG